LTQVVTGPEGTLGILEFSGLPFRPQRAYWITDVPPECTRGGHGHKLLQQAFIVLVGSVNLSVHDGRNVSHYALEANGEPLTLQAGVWRTLGDFEAGTVVLVLASMPYDPHDYIHSLEEFLEWKASLT
jgi:hypothetical protein